MCSSDLGLPDAQHYSTARDLAILASRLIEEHPDYYKLYSERDYTYNAIKQPNRNRLLFIDPTVDGVKTGRIHALDLPGMIAEAKALGIVTADEAAWLAEFDRKVMDIVNVDDFAPHELGTNGGLRVELAATEALAALD